ncbi:undecaprenyl diphosphate synthase family protein, partial [Mycobacterium kansasii]
INEEITEKIFTSYLYTKNLPDLDLIIRTGGEKRLSNFLLWQGSYAELMFLDLLWPDFTPEVLQDCLYQYKLIDRRKGK